VKYEARELLTVPTFAMNSPAKNIFGVSYCSKEPDFEDSIIINNYK